MDIIETIDYRRGMVRMIDQTRLPGEEAVIDIAGVGELAEAIGSLKVRGAPAIGIAAAYGILLALERYLEGRSPEIGYFFDRLDRRMPSSVPGFDRGELVAELSEAAGIIHATRPTAVNLPAALERMKRAVDSPEADAAAWCSAIAGEAFSIHEEELEIERKIGDNGAALIEDGMSLLTHCNAGGLATAGYGTALGVVYSAQAAGKKVRVFATETRPLLQGARLTAWELQRAGIETTVLCDGAAASLMASGKVGAVITGADRIAANGDTANKIGTLSLAAACSLYSIPFYIAAPWSTFDPGLADGTLIPIEERSREEIAQYQGIRTVPDNTGIYNPAFDVTPAGLITCFITESGIISKPFDENIGKALLRI